MLKPYHSRVGEDVIFMNLNPRHKDHSIDSIDFNVSTVLEVQSLHVCEYEDPLGLSILCKITVLNPVTISERERLS